VTQFAVLDALLAGAYESGITVDDVRAAGNFGIGCCEHLGGEVVIIDGEVFECTVDAPPDRMSGAQVLPFVDVCHLPAVASAAGQIEDSDLATFTERVEVGLVSRNLFHAVRVDGDFMSVRVRITARQDHPARPLAEVTHEQIETVITDTSGTLVGFWSPAIYQGIAVAGLHLHYISDDRSVGGHVLDVTVRSASLALAAYARFELHLPTDPQFLNTELTHDDDHRIVAVEAGGASR
jgi:acetolactate decarboxylase